MSVPHLGARPPVLRCSRCGRFVDWESARLQIACHCRPRLDLPPVFVRDITAGERQAVLDLFAPDFGDARFARGEAAVSLETAPALVADVNGELAGALAYGLFDTKLQILALATDPMWQRSGVGGYLLAEAELLARRLDRRCLAVSTTNDNLPALYFYQRHGFRLVEVVREGIVPHVPEHAGFAGILVRDEIRLEKPLG